MGCACGGRKTPQFKVDSYIENGWYYIDLCEGYRLKFRTKVYYLVKGDDIWINSKEAIIKWAKDNCGMDI